MLCMSVARIGIGHKVQKNKNKIINDQNLSNTRLDYGSKKWSIHSIVPLSER